MVTQVRLLGCRPESAPLTELNALGPSTKAGLRRRRISADVYVVAADGSASRIIGATASGTVDASEPAGIGAGPLDVTVRSAIGEPTPAGILGILAHRHNGRPRGGPTTSRPPLDSTVNPTGAGSR
ncbi:hypothetical protein [Micromonospora carbonacea]|uniref:Uncharacterized protein n=1 Tax=Micromonospora carbonacea TaxID=47853 RepID=A0A7H8XFD9_9ACTN|nr:hypothetical protein [Micromonospora carbonacea]MBB5829108.1 hypothetical protein [Micromonospora carbonacea]QLD23404.1 hypothetical protein HXZ27_03475 [Micromonospora carbonacea]